MIFSTINVLNHAIFIKKIFTIFLSLRYYYNEEYVTRAKPFSPLQKEIAGGGSLHVTPFLDGKDHHIRKNLMLKLVDRPSLGGYLQIMDTIFDDAFKKWCTQPEVEMFHEAKMLATHIIFRIIAGVDAFYVNKHANECLEKVDHYVTGLHTKVRVNLPGTLYGKAIEARNFIISTLEKQIKETQIKIGNKEEVPPSFVASLIKNVLPVVPKDHEFETTDQARELLHMSLGTASFATPITYLHMELPKHPEIMNKLKKEIESCWMQKVDSITLNDNPIEETFLEVLDRMQYVDRVVKEILRFYPYVTIFPATARKDFVCDGFKVHEGVILLGAFYSTNHDEKVYKNPEQFDPDRWAPTRAEDERAKCPAFAYVPHGGGTPESNHRCLGEQLIKYGVKLYLIKWLSHYECTKKNQKLDIDWSHGAPIPSSEVKIRVVRNQKE